MTLQDLENTEPWEWPRGAGRKLQEVLRDPKSPASDKTTAAELAGNLVVMDDQMAEVLLGFVRGVDQPAELRARAAISLGPALEAADTEDAGDGDWADVPISEEMYGRIKETLRQVYEDTSAPKEVRRRVLEASVRSPDDWHENAVRAAYSSDDEEWKLTAAFCMRWIPDFEEEILKLLDSPNSEIRYEAILAAGEHEVGAAWPKVRSFLKPPSKDKRLLLAAIEASATIRPEEAQTILAGFVESRDEEIAEAAEDALAMAEGFSDDSDEDEEDEEE